jgi:hypothetical protein
MIVAISTSSSSSSSANISRLAEMLVADEARVGADTIDELNAASCGFDSMAVALDAVSMLRSVDVPVVVPAAVVVVVAIVDVDTVVVEDCTAAVTGVAVVTDEVLVPNCAMTCVPSTTVVDVLAVDCCSALLLLLLSCICGVVTCS